MYLDLDLFFKENICINTTDYRHTKAKSLILSGPNSHPQSQINICDVDIKDCSFFVKLLINSQTWTRDSQYQNGC